MLLGWSRCWPRCAPARSGAAVPAPSTQVWKPRIRTISFRTSCWSDFLASGHRVFNVLYLFTYCIPFYYKVAVYALTPHHTSVCWQNIFRNRLWLFKFSRSPCFIPKRAVGLNPLNPFWTEPGLKVYHTSYFWLILNIE